MNIQLSEPVQQHLEAYLHTGDYDANTIINEALEAYLDIDDTMNEDISEDEAAHIRDIVAPRLQAVQDGTAKLFTVEEVFAEIEAEVLT